jgi:hypothetical protein
LLSGRSVRRAGDSCEAIASDGIVTLIREHDGIRTTLEVSLVEDAPAEERRLTIENLSGRDRRLDVTTYAELVLNTPVADAAHPAFRREGDHGARAAAGITGGGERGGAGVQGRATALLRRGEWGGVEVGAETHLVDFLS